MSNTSSREFRSRFKDAIWYPLEGEDIEIIIGGSGGIGSWLALMLGRADFNLHIYDFDTVEKHNLGGQLFSKEHIGKLKVEAISKILLNFADSECEAFSERYDEDSMATTFMFSAFDNMKARHDMFNNWYETNKGDKNAIFIDGRLLMEQLQVFCVTMETAEEYKKEHLFDDSEVEDLNCTMKQTSHCAAMIASIMTGFFTNHLTNLKKCEKIRDVPFSYHYFLPLHLMG